MILSIVLLWIIINTVLTDGFTRIEKNDTIRNIGRVNDALAETKKNIETKALDWSIWDDLYEYAVNPSKEFEASNLPDITLKSLKLDMLIITDTNRNIVFSKQYHFDRDTATGLLPELEKSIKSDPVFFISKIGLDAIYSGIAMLDSTPVLLSVQPILNSKGQGKPHGTIIFGTFFDKKQISKLQQLTHLPIDILRFDSSLWNSISTSGSNLLNDSLVSVVPQNSNLLAGYICLKDIKNRSAMILNISLHRDIHIQGIRTNYYLTIFIIAAGVLLFAVLSLFLNFFVIGRIRFLDNEITAIEKTSDASARVALNGNDELSHFASSVNGMLAALDAKDKALFARNSEMRLLMNSIPTGLLTIDEYFNINPEYSSSAERILSQSNLSGQHILKVLRINPEMNELYSSMIDFLELMRDDALPESDIEILNPCGELEIDSGGNKCFVQTRFYRIHRGENLPCHILVILENITERKLLAERITITEKENLQLKLIAEDPDLFTDLLSELHRLLDHSLAIINRADNYLSKDMVDNIFRDVHTIKSSAGPFGLDNIVAISGQLEDSLSSLRSRTGISSSSINYIQYNLSRLKNEVHRTVQIIRELFGSEFDDDIDIHLRIPLERIKMEYDALSNLAIENTIDDNQLQSIRAAITDHFIHLRQVTAKMGLAKSIKTAQSLIMRIQKDVTLVLRGEGILIDCEIARYLNNPIIHLIRNCINHGIESDQDERRIAGKLSQGKLFISITKPDPASICIEVGDDGRGIDPEIIKQTAIEKQFITAEAALHLNTDEIISMILLPGFTTSTNQDELSGRGVGMDVVNSVIKEMLHGQLIICSEKGKGTTFRMIIPCSMSDILNINPSAN